MLNLKFSLRFVGSSTSCLKISPLTGQYLVIGFDSGEIMIVHMENLLQFADKNALKTTSIDEESLINLNPAIKFIRQQCGGWKNTSKNQNMYNNDNIEYRDHRSNNGNDNNYNNDDNFRDNLEISPSLLCTTITNSALNSSILERFPFIKNYFLAHRNGGVNCLDWSWDESYIATCSNDKTIRIFDTETTKTLKILHGHYNIVYSVKFSPTASMLASASFDETVRIWSTITGECLRILSAHTDPVTCVDFSHDGSILMSCGFDGHVRLWDTSTGQCLKSFVSSQLLKNPPVAYCRFSPNSNYCMGLIFDGCIRLWKCDTTTQVSQSSEVGSGGAIRVYIDAHRLSGKYLTNLEWFMPNDKLTLIAVPSEPESCQQHYNFYSRPHYTPKDSPLPEPSIVLYDVQSKKVVQKVATEFHQSVLTFISSRKEYLASCDQNGSVVMWKWTNTLSE